MSKILPIKIAFGIFIISGMAGNEISSMAIANSVKAQVQIIAQKIKQTIYGLGLPKTAGTGGSVRLKEELGGFESSGGKTLPILALMVPEDGARTASAQPTVYWNMILNEPQDYKLTFFLQEAAAENSKVIFEQEITITKGGLFKFQLPQSLGANIPRRWGVKCKWASGKVVEANGILAFTDPKPEFKVALESAQSSLEKARVYVSYGYWYDALDAYNNWITANPQDAKAIQERSSLISEGFQGHKGLNTKAFIAQINTAAIQEFK
jgi:hypothetical protein